MRTVGGIRPALLVGRIPSPVDMRPKEPTQTLEDLPDCSIRLRLCEDGPDGCKNCLICGYGREYLRRQALPRERKARTRKKSK